VTPLSVSITERQFWFGVNEKKARVIKLAMGQYIHAHNYIKHFDSDLYEQSQLKLMEKWVIAIKCMFNC